MNRRVRDPYARWCERAEAESNLPPHSTRLGIFYLIIILKASLYFPLDLNPDTIVSASCLV